MFPSPKDKLKAERTLRVEEKLKKKTKNMKQIGWTLDFGLFGKRNLKRTTFSFFKIVKIFFFANLCQFREKLCV